MPIRRKVTGLKRGSKGFVYRIPISELGNLSEDEVNKHLREVFGTDELKIDGLSFKKYLIQFQDKIGRTNPRVEYNGKNKEIQTTFENRKPGRRAGSYDVNHKRIVVDNDGKYITFKPEVLLHGVTGERFSSFHSKSARFDIPGGETSTDTYKDLLNILREGFSGRGTQYGDNIVRKKDKKHRFSLSGRIDNIYGDWSQPNPGEGITQGDSYTLEIVPKEGVRQNPERDSYDPSFLESASPKDILGVNIKINANNSKEDIEKKMDFYRKEISEKYGIPVRYFTVERESILGSSGLDEPQRIFPKKKLEQIVSGVVGIFGICSSLFFLGSSLTGNAIASISRSSGSWLGIGLLLVGIAGALFYFRSKKRWPIYKK